MPNPDLYSQSRWEASYPSCSDGSGEESSQDVDFWFYASQIGREGRRRKWHQKSNKGGEEAYISGQLGREERQRKWHQTIKNGGEDAKGSRQGANTFAIRDKDHRFIAPV